MSVGLICLPLIYGLLATAVCAAICYAALQHVAPNHDYERVMAELERAEAMPREPA